MPITLRPDDLPRLGPDARSAIASALSHQVGVPVAVAGADAPPADPPARAGALAWLRDWLTEPAPLPAADHRAEGRSPGRRAPGSGRGAGGGPGEGRRPGRKQWRTAGYLVAGAAACGIVALAAFGLAILWPRGTPPACLQTTCVGGGLAPARNWGPPTATTASGGAAAPVSAPAPAAAPAAPSQSAGGAAAPAAPAPTVSSAPTANPGGPSTSPLPNPTGAVTSNAPSVVACLEQNGLAPQVAVADANNDQATGALLDSCRNNVDYRAPAAGPPPPQQCAIQSGSAAQWSCTGGAVNYPAAGQTYILPAGSTTWTQQPPAQSAPAPGVFCPPAITGVVSPPAVGNRIAVQVDLAGPDGITPQMSAMVDTGGVYSTFADSTLQGIGYHPYASVIGSGIVAGATEVEHLYRIPGSAINVVDQGVSVALASGTVTVLGTPHPTEDSLGPDLLRDGVSLGVAAGQWWLAPAC